MVKYVLKRLLMLIPVMLGITFFIFVILSLAPGDPASMILGQEATPEQLEALRTQMGLDQPLLTRYFSYIWGVLRGDFGTSWINSYDVFSEFMSRLPNTLMLGMLSMAIAIVVGIPMGVIAAIRQNKVVDRVTLVCAMLFACLPGFWLGMMAQVYFCLTLGWLPASGVGSLSHFIMPALTLGAGTLATMVRLTRSSMLDIKHQDFVRTARAKGVVEYKVIFGHMFRNALLPVITQVGMGFAAIMGGASVTESVFGIPGVGSLLINAVKSRDIPVVMGTIVFVGLFVGIVNLVVDLIYAIVDPRVKLDG